jgi:ABC-type xylose transport system permease subunit
VNFAGQKEVTAEYSPKSCGEWKRRGQRFGGTSLAGGSGSVGRAMFGVAIIAVINNGMNLMHVSSYWQKVVIGCIILLAVILDMAQKKKS